MSANESHDTITIGKNTGAPVTVYFSRWTTSSRYSTTEHVSIAVSHSNGKRDRCEGKNTWNNRPWQEFTYQRAATSAAKTMLDEARAHELEAWKALKGYERMNEKRREEWRGAEPVFWFADEERARALVVYLLARNDFTRPEYAPVLSALESLEGVSCVGDGVYVFRCRTVERPRCRVRWNSRMGQYGAGAIEILG